MINRRQILKGLVCASVAGVVLTDEAKALMKTTLHDSDHHDITKGFGLAPVKAEGATVSYDPYEGDYATRYRWVTSESIEDGRWSSNEEWEQVAIAGDMVLIRYVIPIEAMMHDIGC